MPSRRVRRTDIAISGFAPRHPSSGKLRSAVKIHSLMKAAPYRHYSLSLKRCRHLLPGVVLGGPRHNSPVGYCARRPSELNHRYELLLR
jgi:hypothetical protein